MAIETIKATELPNVLAEGNTVLDVRSPAEFRSAHVSGAELCPLDELDGEAYCEQNDVGFPVYLICQTDKRASLAAKKLVDAGHQSVYVVEGGTNAAKDAGVEMEYGEGTLSMGRQVRIFAGALVLLGTLGGAYLHPGFLILSAVVGADLVFAGATDRCGIGLILAKMPWNR